MDKNQTAAGYQLSQLAPGAYDILWMDEPVASLVEVPQVGWWIEVLQEGRKMPPPFTAARHRFASLKDAQEWLGLPGAA